MSFKEYEAVGNSSLYDGEGTVKAVLSRIAYLVRDKRPTENCPLGWCNAGEKYLSSWTGFNERTVRRVVQRLIEDEVIYRVVVRLPNGWRKNRYSLNMDKINEARRPLDTVEEVPQGGSPSGGYASDDSETMPQGATPAGHRAITTEPQGDKAGATGRSTLKAVELSSYHSSSIEADETIAIADSDPAMQEDQKQKTAGETPANPPSPVRESKVFCSDDTKHGIPVYGSLPVQGPTPPHDSAVLPSLEDESARWMANYLWCFLSVREDVEVLPGWEKFWTKDFQDALNSGWSAEDLKRAIRASQVGRAREFYKRGASISANLDLLAENGQKLESKGLLCDFECPKCHGLFIGVEALVEHQLCCYEKPVGPEDAAEEEAMYFADELVSEGYFAEHPEMATYYPWGDDDKQVFDPWSDVPGQVPPLERRFRTEEV